jgi:hypothetical protein
MSDLDAPRGLQITTGAQPSLDEGIGATLPVGFRIQSEGNSLIIVRTARPKTTWFFTLFAVVLNGIVSLFVFPALLAGAWGMLPFLAIHIVVGLAMAYAAVRCWVNHTRISVSW